jgi:hypothetical protein
LNSFHVLSLDEHSFIQTFIQCGGGPSKYGGRAVMSSAAVAS